MATRTEDLETLLTRIPDRAIRSLFSPEFILCAEHFDQFTIEFVLRLCHELGFDRDLARGVSSRALVSDRSFAPRAEIPVR